MTNRKRLTQSKIGIVPLNWQFTDERKELVAKKLAEYGFLGIQILEHQAVSSEYRDLLATHNLKAVEFYIPIKCNQDSVLQGSDETSKRQIDAAKSAGVEIIVFAVDGSEDRDKVASNAAAGPKLSVTGFQQLADHINHWSKYAQSLGMKASFHPHAATYIETSDEAATLFTLLESNVGLCLDVGHWTVGGGDSVQAINEYGSRITHMHIKDVDPSVLTKLKSREIESMDVAVREHKLFAPAGTGHIDLLEIFSALEKNGYAGWLMSEQDSAWEPAEEKSELSYRNMEQALVN